jgi:hypothetical protein
MRTDSVTRRSPLSAVLLTGVLVLSGLAPTLAQQRGDQRPASVPAAGAAPTGVQERAPREAMDAQATRSQLMRVLEKHPPSVARILRLDPSLMRSESYLQAYPDLRDFLAEHPEIPQNAPFYLQNVHVDGWEPRNARLEILEGVLAGLAAFTGIGIALGVVIWMIRTVLEQRRWNRLSKIQADVHMKLMDRFSSNDELMTYVQTPSGRRFLESGPSPLQETAPAVAAPFSRILWSVQLGVVLLVTGVGMLFLSGQVIEEAREFFFIAGCLASAIGTGFVVSAAASYFLSRRLGLIDASGPSHA